MSVFLVVWALLGGILVGIGILVLTITLMLAAFTGPDRETRPDLKMGGWFVLAGLTLPLMLVGGLGVGIYRAVNHK